ncbi:MAG: chorismate-binding protein [Chloroflexi bacterium]|nr:chorismate-binding protein [Chloroflexota bacterium]
MGAVCGVGLGPTGRGYAAYVDTGRHVLCSASPELFFQLDGDLLTARPMKGTAVRGLTLAEDEANMAWLHQSEKNRAENRDDCRHDPQRHGAGGRNRQRGRAQLV